MTDVFDLDADDDLREQIEKSARHLYGLVHARYIVTTRGLAKMVSPKATPALVFPSLLHKLELMKTSSLTSIRSVTLANALVLCVTGTLFSLWARPIFPT